MIKSNRAHQCFSLESCTDWLESKKYIVGKQVGEKIIWVRQVNYTHTFNRICWIKSFVCTFLLKGERSYSFSFQPLLAVSDQCVQHFIQLLNVDLVWPGKKLQLVAGLLHFWDFWRLGTFGLCFLCIALLFCWAWCNHNTIHGVIEFSIKYSMKFCAWWDTGCLSIFFFVFSEVPGKC